MASILDAKLDVLNTMIPTEEGREDACRAAATLEAAPDDKHLVLEAGATRVDVPAAMATGVRALLEAILREAGHGRTVLVASTAAEEVSTGAAAKILKISRTHLVNLIKRGVIPARTVREGSNSHRRVRVSDVLAYQRRLDVGATALAAAERLADELDLDGLDQDEP